MEIKYIIGYIDEDINQVKKYTRRLKEFGFEVIGYDFFKGMSLDELMSQVYQSNIDLLMIDYKLKESNIVTFNGDAVESEFYDKKPLFPHIIFTNKVDQAEPFVEDWKIIFDKDEIFSDDEEDEKKVTHFITTIIKSIEQYRNHFNKKKAILAKLIEKSENTKLTLPEIEVLLKTKKELQVLDSSSSYDVPEYLLLPENIEKIDNLKNEAAEFLEELIKRKKI